MSSSSSRSRLGCTNSAGVPIRRFAGGSNTCTPRGFRGGRTRKERAMAGAIDPLGHRKNALDAFLETKVAEGFRIETHTDTHAIIIVGGHRKPLWSRFRKHTAGSRYVVSVDEHGEVTMLPAEPKRTQIRNPWPATT